MAKPNNKDGKLTEKQKMVREEMTEYIKSVIIDQLITSA